MTKSAVHRRHLPSSPFNVRETPPVKLFEEGERVTHDRYGLGRVVSVEGDVAVLVDFGSRQERIPRPYAKLNKL